ncbi:MAG: Integral rane protein TerC [Gemmatimonadetes bacterium]|jgi:tellurite resistance protein TerC|nr:Integral rane protein TerC [Gemmatimonadota bacterium]
MIATNIWFWVGFIAFVLAMLSLDLGVFNRTPHVVKAREALVWTSVWVGLALVFAGGLAVFADRQAALTFLTGYVIEESLSVDNIFVIVLIFQYFAVPAQYQHRVLFWGILGALVMRGLFIGLGAALLAKFEWIIYIFGALLVVTGIRMAVKGDEEFDGEQNPVVKFVRKVVPLTDGYRGKHFFSIENGKRHATPLLLVLMLVEATDLIFAVDSIPAIFGITRDPFIVFTSNIFAVMGLRSLFFLLAHVVTKFHLLKYGLAFILTFVGAKMLLESWIHIPILLSLGVVVGVLAASIVASLVWPAPKSEGKTGSMFGS